jgi:4-amino-4-deoxy-L-arabinose transferase-like glycosyltransferase
MTSTAAHLPIPLERTDAATSESATVGVVATRPWPWERIGLVAIVVLAAALEFWRINQLGTPNTFYAAAVLSMTQNLHAFFFNSLDSIGLVTIDKPPLGFWIQVVSARLLGFSGFSILLPEALATVGSVVLVYVLVKRAFGGAAGLLAALMLALVPVSVMIGRNNTIDALLVFCLMLAVWTSLKATEAGSLKWLLLTGVVVGLGFEIKMLEAYLVVPALGLVYLLCAPIPWPKRIGHLALAGVVMLAVSLAWPLAVDLTPANLRPWVDSTQDNSAISLALGYNGIDRLIGQRESLTQFLSGLGLRLPSSDATAAGFGGNSGGFGGMFNNGPAGPFRLFDQELGGQASWLLPLSLLTMAIALWKSITRRTAFFRTRQGQTAIVFGMWLLTAGTFFSVANFFHSYYLVTLGPPIAALAAIAIVGLWREFRAHSWLGWLLPVAVLGTTLVQADLLVSYAGWSAWLTPVLIGAALVAAAGLLYGLLGERLGGSLNVARAATGLAIVALLLVPAMWSAYTVSSARGGGGIPAAGPQAAGARGFGFGAPPGGAPGGNVRRGDGSGPPGGGGGPAGFGFGPGGNTSSAMIDYLVANQGSTPYLVATTDSNTAAPIILATGKPVMSLGGFSGGDPILSVDQFASLVSSGEVHYVLVGGRGFGGRGGTGAIMSWVEANGTPVSIAGAQTQLYQVGN